MELALLDFAIYALLGAVAGLLAGLLGVGGGLVIVPVLALAFTRQGVSAALLMHLAIGTSLATIVITSLASVRAHHRRGAVDWSVFLRLMPGIVFGAGLGAMLADYLPSTALRIFFGIFATGVALQMGLRIKPAPHRELPGKPGMITAGAFIGAVSAVVGIGGGSLTVPFLVWSNVVVRRAVATSSACGLPIAVAGALGFIVMGWNAPQLPLGSSGYVYWPAFLGIVATSILFAPLGAQLAHSLPTASLQQVFAVFLAIVGLGMILPS